MYQTDKLSVSTFRTCANAQEIPDSNHESSNWKSDSAGNSFQHPDHNARIDVFSTFLRTFLPKNERILNFFEEFSISTVVSIKTNGMYYVL